MAAQTLGSKRGKGGGLALLSDRLTQLCLGCCPSYKETSNYDQQEEQQKQEEQEEEEDELEQQVGEEEQEKQEEQKEELVKKD